MKNNTQELIISQPNFWLEDINNKVYNALLDYMENEHLNKKKLANHLGISKGRLSQILNDGETNFSIKKLVQICLKINLIPKLEFEDKQIYLNNLNSERSFTIDPFLSYTSPFRKTNKIIRLRNPIGLQKDFV